MLLFDGNEVVKEDALTDASPLSQYKAENKFHEQERDVAKYWKDKNSNIRICLYGLENQTAIDTDIPLRVISYDGAAYRAQLLDDKDKNKDNAKQKRYPVVTLVLYFGEKRWNRPHSLKECLDIPKELEPYVSDYKVNVFEIAWLEDETVQKSELTGKPLIAAFSLLIFSYDLQLKVNAVLLIFPHFYTSVGVLIYGGSSK